MFQKYLIPSLNWLGSPIFLNFLSVREGREGIRGHYCYDWLWVTWFWFILLSAKESGKLLKAQQNNINKDHFLS